jgi:uncharacterized protein with gpF-like domain
MASLLGSGRAEQRRQMAILDRIEAAFMPQIAREIARSMRWTIEQFEKTGATVRDPQHKPNLQDILERQATIAVGLFGRRVLGAQVKSGKAYTTDGQNVLFSHGGAGLMERKDFATTVAKLAGRYIANESFRRRITDISETTRGQIVNAVDRGFSEGLGTSETAKLVRDLVPALSRQRSALIARTETHGAANYGGYGAAQETGLKLRKEWISAEDERTRQDHADMDGTIVDMDGAFNFPGYSLFYPGEPGGPAEGVINCRCAVGWVTLD